jgi:RHS repeat-associated protein
LDIIQEKQNGAVYANYIRILNIDEPVVRIKGSVIRHYKTDALGTVIQLLDDSGNIKTTYTYDPFGGVTASGETSDNPFQYTGRENDGTGLHYYRARYYSPELQRFISEDPIGLAGGINLYRYVGNNPVNFVDLFGLFYFGKRPLLNGEAPWIPDVSSNPIDDFLNTELSHEHGFFEDGTGDNIGFGKYGRFSEDPTGKGYRYDNKRYEDALMREALKHVKDAKYSNMPWKQYNCQDWAEDLRNEYEKLRRKREKNRGN